ncbi:MAG: proline iminopeptidase-family hydrolase [Saprospiraceae bacterium]
MNNWIFIAILLCLSGCKASSPEAEAQTEAIETAAEVLPKGVKLIPIQTPKGKFSVYTRQVGESPTIKVLLLHGGPGTTHELWEPLADYLPQEGIEYYYYDQLGSHFSTQPSDTSLWTIPRFVDEVEQVRTALGLTPDNFILMGQSWGGMLAMEYALVHQDKLKGLVVSNMMSSIPEYNKYVLEVLAPKLPKAVLDSLLSIEASEDYNNPLYMQLLEEHYYPRHVVNMPIEKWPESLIRTYRHMNMKIYIICKGLANLE